MSEVDLARLQARVEALEDRLAIYQLMVSHPPAVDGGAIDRWAQAWTPDAEFDRGAPDPEAHSGDYAGTYGLDVILKEMSGSELETARDAGLAHMTTIPYLNVSADTAVATNYTFVLGYENPGFRIRRIVANRWDLERHTGKWKIRKRTLRLLDGSKDARDLLRRGVETA